jgi:hypothetical protein
MLYHVLERSSGLRLKYALRKSVGVFTLTAGASRRTDAYQCAQLIFIEVNLDKSDERRAQGTSSDEDRSLHVLRKIGKRSI